MSENTNNYLQNAIIKHSVLFQRYAKGQERAVLQELRLLAEEARRTLASTGDRIARRDVQQDIIELDTLIDHFQIRAYEEITKSVEESSDSLLIFLYALMSRASLPKLSKPTLGNKILTSTMPVNPGVSSVNVRGLVETMSGFLRTVIKREVQDGYLKNVPASAIADNIQDIVSTVGKRNAQAVVSTVLNHVETTTIKAMMDENPAIFEYYRWVSVLDNKTSFICAGRHGRIYRRGNGPLPPAHYNCRSKIVPLTKSEFAAIVKNSPSPTNNFDSWLRAQSDEFQLEYLGPSRYQIYKQGDLTIDKFRDELGRTYNLEQLQQLYGIML